MKSNLKPFMTDSITCENLSKWHVAYSYITEPHAKPYIFIPRNTLMPDGTQGVCCNTFGPYNSAKEAIFFSESEKFLSWKNEYDEICKKHYEER